VSGDRGGSSAEQGSARLGLALVRIAALPVIFVGERLVQHPPLQGEPFDYVFAATTVYAFAALLTSRPDWGRSVLPGWSYAVLDFTSICALAYTSGGAFSQLRYVFFVLPVGAAFLLRPALTAAASAATVGAYVTISLSHPGTQPEDLEFVLTQALSLTWMGLAAVALSYSLTRREERIEQLAADRGRLVAEALDAEDRERRRLAEALHDEAIQNLLAARQDLKEAERRPGAIEYARRGIDSSLTQLRAAVFDLHPYVLERAGLAAAVQAVAAQQERIGGFEARVRVDPEAAGIHDQLMLSVARELLNNVAKHAAARRVSVAVCRQEDRIVLDVRDNGRGIDQTAVAGAVAAGHIGLASCAGRVDAVGGRLEISQNGMGGTRVRVEAPVTSS
jgi:two-component system NarL family sensor kinase